MNADESFHLRLLKFQEGSLSPEEFEAFNAELRESPELRDAFIEQNHFAQLLREVPQISEPAAPSPPVRGNFFSPTRLAVGLAAAVAVLLLAWQGMKSPDAPASPNTPIATLSHSAGARWSDGSVVQNLELTSPRLLEFETGLVRLDFANGACLALEGNSALEIVDAMKVRLIRGVLTAEIPETAHGFTVDTASASVIDYGTAFGVSVGQDGQTDVCVFEGEVGVTTDSQTDPLHLFEGDAVQAAPSFDGLREVAFDTSLYENAWPVTSGVLQTTGILKFAAPGPDFVPGKFEDNDHIVVFREQQHVTLEAPVLVDLAEPGEYWKLSAEERRSHVASGREVGSFLFQLNPVGSIRPDDEIGPRTVMGQITFDRPILGVITTTDTLEASDEALGDPRGHYLRGTRGIEARRKLTKPPGEGKDLIILAADRRTLILSLTAATSLDQIRVLVDHTP